MTPAEAIAAIRAIFTQADADAPEIPPTPDPPANPPPPVAPLPEAGQQAIVDAVLAALAAQQQTRTRQPSEPPARSGHPASAAGSGAAVGWATGQPAHQRQERVTDG